MPWIYCQLAWRAASTCHFDPVGPRALNWSRGPWRLTLRGTSRCEPDEAARVIHEPHLLDCLALS